MDDTGQQQYAQSIDAEPTDAELAQLTDASALQGKENAGGFQLSRYVKGRVPARSALRKSLAPGADEGMQSLLSNFNALQESVAQFNQESQRRQDSIAGREAGKHNAACMRQPCPSNTAQAPACTAGTAGLQAHSVTAAAAGSSAPPAPMPRAAAAAAACEASQDQAMDLDDSQQGPEVASQTQPLVTIPAALASSKHGKAASDLFLDPLLTKALYDILNRRLQRTKDGATDKTRIQELAGRLPMQSRHAWWLVVCEANAARVQHICPCM